MIDEVSREVRNRKQKTKKQKNSKNTHNTLDKNITEQVHFRYITVHEMSFAIKKTFLETADLLKYAKEILNGEISCFVHCVD